MWVGKNRCAILTGKERDPESGLDFFAARYYSGPQGRFTSPDWSAEPTPVPYADLSDPQTLNLYAYVRNNPLRFSDPDGHGFWSKLGNWLTGGGWNEDPEAERVRQAAVQHRADQARADLSKMRGFTINGQTPAQIATNPNNQQVLNEYNQALAFLSGVLIQDAFSPCPPGVTCGMMPLAPGQLQAKFKHAGDFGVEGNWNKVTANQFERAIQNHVNDPATQVIKGTYRGQPVVHHLNPNTRLNVITDPGGNFISGWKLNPQQLQNVLTRGSL